MLLITPVFQSTDYTYLWLGLAWPCGSYRPFKGDKLAAESQREVAFSDLFFAVSQ